MQPIPRDPVDGVDLRGCAMIAAELADGAQARGAVLARHRLDELRWANIEKTWMLRLAAAMLAGDHALAQDYDALLSEAQGALHAGEPGLELDAYVAIMARLEAGYASSRALTEAGVTAAAFARAQKSWATRLSRDPALSAEVRRRVAAERARLG